MTSLAGLCWACKLYADRLFGWEGITHRGIWCIDCWRAQCDPASTARREY